MVRATRVAHRRHRRPDADTRRVRRLHEVSTAVYRTEPWQFKRVLALIEHCTAREFVREVFDHHRGAHRVFTADAFLAAYLLTPPMLGIALHQTNVTAVVRGWTTSQRRSLGLRPMRSSRTRASTMRCVACCGRADRPAIRSGTNAASRRLSSMRPCGVIRRPVPSPWIRRTFRRGRRFGTANRSSTPTPTGGCHRPIIRWRPPRTRSIPPMPVAAGIISRTRRSRGQAVHLHGRYHRSNGLA